jgi:hypothetical protein
MTLVGLQRHRKKKSNEEVGLSSGLQTFVLIARVSLAVCRHKSWSPPYYTTTFTRTVYLHLYRVISQITKIYYKITTWSTKGAHVKVY